MKQFFSNYGWFVLEVLSGLIVIGLVMSVFDNEGLVGSKDFLNLNQTVMGADVDYTIPTVEEGGFVVENGILDKGAVFNWKDYVTATSSNGEDLLSYITVSGDVVNTSRPGMYRVQFTLNWNGKSVTKISNIYVKDGF